MFLQCYSSITRWPHEGRISKKSCTINESCRCCLSRGDKQNGVGADGVLGLLSSGFPQLYSPISRSLAQLPDEERWGDGQRTGTCRDPPFLLLHFALEKPFTPREVRISSARNRVNCHPPWWVPIYTALMGRTYELGYQIFKTLPSFYSSYYVFVELSTRMHITCNLP